MQRCALWVVGLCISASLMFFSGAAHSRDRYLTLWDEAYPDSTSDDAICQLCHERGGGGNGWNSYGWSIRNAYFPNLASSGSSDTALRQALQDIAGITDGASSTFINEINANAQPGWRPGEVNQINFVSGSPTLISPPATLPCGLRIDEGDTDLTCSTTNPIPTGISAGPQVGLETVADGFTAPVAAVSEAGFGDDIFVVEQGGRIWRVSLRDGAKSLYLDFSSELVSNFGQLFAGSSFEGFDERGLLGFVFHPDFANNNKVYTYISSDHVENAAHFTTLTGGQDADHMSVVSEWVVVNPQSSNPQATAQREILIVDQPQFNHNGGMLAFGPEGNLFIALGDGGSANDTGDGHGSNGNGRDNTNPLGAILRIDVDTVAPANGRYGIPNTNPFVSGAGLDEIYVYGLRNPYRFAIEENASSGHDLFIGDVGQDAIEELNRVPLSDSGSNFGWNYKEGRFFFSVQNGSTFVSPNPPSGVMIPPLVDPLVQYDHNEGISVIAGFTYRGSAIPTLTGQYVFADWGRSFASPDGRLLLVNSSDQLRELRVPGGAGLHITGFGQDREGEIYVVGSQGFRVTDQGMGSLRKLVPQNDELCVPIKGRNNSFAVVCF